jgi:hypothetical protein
VPGWIQEEFARKEYQRKEALAVSIVWKDRICIHQKRLTYLIGSHLGKI